ncbi:MAG: fimbrillin family protein, partial [Muribaculaceae bacterium]|nr:fimbrillin family protein [Muribaculaceae bacterium]
MVVGGLVVLASCSQEEVVSPGHQNKDGLPISFRAGVATRVNPDLDYTTNPSTFYVTSFKDSHKAVNGEAPTPFFEDEPFYMMGANLYASTSNQKWPLQEEAKQLEFFAYAPSLEEIQTAAMTQLNPADENYANLLANYTSAIQFFNLCKDGVSLDPMGQENSTFNGVQLY